MGIDILDILSPHRPFSFSTAVVVVSGGVRFVAVSIYVSGAAVLEVYS